MGRGYLIVTQPPETGGDITLEVTRNSKGYNWRVLITRPARTQIEVDAALAELDRINSRLATTYGAQED